MICHVIGANQHPKSKIKKKAHMPLLTSGTFVYHVADNHTISLFFTIE